MGYWNTVVCNMHRGYCINHKVVYHILAVYFISCLILQYPNDLCGVWTIIHQRPSPQFHCPPLWQFRFHEKVKPVGAACNIQKQFLADTHHDGGWPYHVETSPQISPTLTALAASVLAAPLPTPRIPGVTLRAIQPSHPLRTRFRDTEPRSWTNLASKFPGFDWSIGSRSPRAARDDVFLMRSLEDSTIASVDQVERRRPRVALHP
ncbi:hypothetical protein AB1N83_011930 [Pleurotus pulmonarius]